MCTNRKWHATLYAIALGFSIIFAGCGDALVENEELKVSDAQIREVYDEFQEDCIRYTGGRCVLPLTADGRILRGRISVGNNGEGITALGLCRKQYSYSGARGWRWEYLVVVDTDLTGQKLKGVLYHELGHCLLGKGHTNTPGHPMHWKLEESCLGSSGAEWQQCVRNLFIQR